MEIIPRVATLCLSIHAGYRCRHSGACCTAGWAIPVEPERVAALVARGLVPDGAGARRMVWRSADRAGVQTFVAARNADGACVFHDSAGRSCAIHRDVGPELLPSACRNFPRVALRDGRGLSVTLSHYCPTAARLLLEAGDIAIVPAPPSISLMGEVDGLDATGVLPPLLHANMLTDLEGYGAWEREGIAVLNERNYSARQALAVIEAATQDARDWRPGQETLAGRMSRAFARARERCSENVHSAYEHATKAFLAAHLFGSWWAYQGGGLPAVVGQLHTALGLLGAPADDQAFISAVRAADLRLRHGRDN